MMLLGDPPVEAILLDIDGTIADTDDAAVARLERWFRRVPWLPPGREPVRYARRFVMGVETPVNNLVGWLDRSGLDRVTGPLLEALHKLRGVVGHAHAALIPGVRNALMRLAERYPLGIVTAREHSSAHAILEAHGLSPLFRCVATARTCRRAKPHPDPVAWAVGELGVRPEASIMVGDTTADILSGRAAGLRTVGVLCGFGQRDELEHAGADLILPSTTDLADLLLGH